MYKYAVVGAGAWGTAIANMLAKKDSAKVIIWANEQEVIEEINSVHRNSSYLPGIILRRRKLSDIKKRKAEKQKKAIEEKVLEKKRARKKKLKSRNSKSASKLGGRRATVKKTTIKLNTKAVRKKIF